MLFIVKINRKQNKRREIMEIQLQELIDEIKQNGVEAAEAEAKSIVDAAKAEAQKIVSDAKAKADKLLADAKAENEKIVKSGEDAIRQAGRNLLISFRESVTRELKAIVRDNVESVYSSASFSELVIHTVEAWAKNPDTEDISVILNEDDLKAIEKTLLSSLRERMAKGVTLKANDNFDGGFRVSVNGDGAYYDYSADAVVEMLSNYLSPRVSELLREAK